MFCCLLVDLLLRYNRDVLSWRYFKVVKQLTANKQLTRFNVKKFKDLHASYVIIEKRKFVSEEIT